MNLRQQAIQVIKDMERWATLPKIKWAKFPTNAPEGNGRRL